MADPVSVGRIALLVAKLAKDENVHKFVAVAAAVVIAVVMLIVLLPTAIVSGLFAMLNPEGDALVQDPYYIAMQEVRAELAIENELPIIIPKAIDLVHSGDITFSVDNAKDFVLQHLIGSEEITTTVYETDPLHPDTMIAVEHTETICYFYSATEMLRKIQNPPYSFSEQDIKVIQDMYLIAEGNGGLGSFGGTLPMPVQGYLTSGYGNRFDPINGEYFMHPAIDILPEWHSPIIAIANGEVVAVTIDDIYGNNITIRHELEEVTIYSFSAHLSRVDVVLGEDVRQGQVIGLEGGDQQYDPNAGRTTGHHLHFEIWESPSRSGHVDPRKYLKG